MLERLFGYGRRALVVLVIIVQIGKASGQDINTKPSLSMQEYKRERNELVDRWFSGNHRLGDEERMFEEL